jgi:hypothetical protein
MAIELILFRTRVGVVICVVLPFPNWPPEFCPLAQTLPSVFRNKDEYPPAAIILTCDSMN